MRIVTLTILICLLISTSVSGESVYADQDWLLERYRSGDIDTLRAILDSIPEMSDMGQFFRGIFETDGEAARFYFNRIVTLYPNSVVEAYALERLWQYHWAKGDSEMTRRYWDFLERRHPDYSGLKQQPNFSHANGLGELTVVEIPPPASFTEEEEPYWTIQLGAYKNEMGAREVGQKAMGFGRVRYLKKEVKGSELTIVRVGRFQTRDEAKTVQKNIKAVTGIKGRILIVNNK